jgi:hypothetical protein
MLMAVDLEAASVTDLSPWRRLQPACEAAVPPGRLPARPLRSVPP